MVKTLSSLITLTFKKLKQLFCSFLNVNFILGWQMFMPFLNDSTWVSDSISHDILNQNPNLFMASLDVDSLFTNITLDETINIIIEKLFSENETVHNLNKDQFKCLLTLATKESDFVFNGELHQQVDNVAMGSPLGPTLANIFFCHYEDIWLCNCSLECQPSYYKGYVDDIFALFEPETRVESFRNFMNTCHPKMKFTFKKELNNCFNFLDAKVIRRDNVFTTSVYRKPSFSGILIVTCH